MKFVDNFPLSFVVRDEKITLNDKRVKTGSKGCEGIFETQEYIIDDFNLKITVYYKKYWEFDVSEFYYRFENIGNVYTPVLSNVLPCDLMLDNEAGFEPWVHYATGGMCSKNDFEPHDSKFWYPNVFKLFSEGGRSSSLFMPFFNLKTAKEKYIFGIGWSGDWEADFIPTPKQEKIRLTIGMKETEFYLYPGENVRTPKIMVMNYEGEQIDGQNKLRRHIFKNHNHYMNRTGKAEMPTFSINWGDCPCENHLENVQTIIDNDLDIEVYWIDASWFGKKSVWMPCTGDWDTIKKDKYPREFKPLTDLLHKNNRKFLLWFEPERICEGTDFERLGDYLIELPQNLLSPRDSDIGEWDPRFPIKENLRNIFQAGDKLIDFSNPKAVDYYIEYFTEFIKKHKIDFYRHDANIATDAYFKAKDREKRRGITEMKWVEGLYRFWDTLLENCPNLIIDNCASGGRRIDLEMMDRSVVTTRTDCVWSEEFKQSHGLGLNEWYMYHTCTRGSRLRKDTLKDFDYIIASNLGLGMMFDLSREIAFSKEEEYKYKVPKDNYNFPAIKDALAKYRKLQPFCKYDFYPLTSYSWRDDACVAYEYYSPEEDKGLVVLIRRENCPMDRGTFELKGLKNRKYDIEYVMGNYGLELTENKLKAEFGKKHSACCVIFK